MKNIILIISVLSLILGCESVVLNHNDTGTIEGEVIIAPLCGNIPVITNTSNPCGFNDEQLNQIYSKYKVTLSGKANGKAIFEEVILNKTGLFTFNAPVGIYKVAVVLPEGTVNQTGSTTTNSLTKDVTLKKNQVVKFNIMVDTGIQ